MVFTLHRYIFWELLKIFVLAAVALTLMLSFGSLLKPIQDYGVGPAQILKILLYFVPIMLTFILPIAALFAASLVYGRFANDNELDACRASGIGLWTLIYPGLTLAILVAIANLFLSFYVVPNYVHRAEKAIKADAKQILFRNLKRKGSFEIPGSSKGSYRIHADDVIPEKNQLDGIIVAEVQDQKTKKLITARRAEVLIEPHRNTNQVTITAFDAYQLDEQNRASFGNISVGAEFGSPLSDRIKFKQIDEMKRIRNDPLQFYPVARLANATYIQLIAEMLANDIKLKLADGSQTLYGNTQRIEFIANDCKAKSRAQLELSGNVTVAEYTSLKKASEPDFTYKSSRAIIEVQLGPDGPIMEMTIADTPEWRRPNGARGWSSQHVIKNLSLPTSVSEKLKNNVLNTVAEIPTLLENPSQELIALQVRTNDEIDETMTDIDIEINWRLVFGISCVGLILIGSGLGILLKGGHLLTAFGASAVPAAILIVCIAMGKNLAGYWSYIGITLMWTALLILGILTAAIYRKLLKT